MKRILIGLVLLGSGCATTNWGDAPFAPDEVQDALVLTGPENLRAEVIQTNSSGLVRFQSADPKIDGYVLPVSVEGDLSHRWYKTKINGRDIRVLIRKNDNWHTYTPGSKVSLQLDEEASATLNEKELIKLHLKQAEAGDLTKIATFDVQGEKQKELEKLTTEIHRDLGKNCEIKPEVNIDWNNISDQELMEYSVASYCESAISGLDRACKIPELKSFISRNVKNIQCGFGPELSHQWRDEKITFTVKFETANLSDWVRKEIDKINVSADRTIRQVRIEDSTVICADAELNHIIVQGPHEDKATEGVSYGNKKVVYRQPKRRMLPGGWFFEPRFYNSQNNENFRGYDLRQFSHVSVKDGSCTLTCGQRKIALQQLQSNEKTEVLKNLEFKTRPDIRTPYALARDKRGRYYFVDKGSTPETQKDFRLYVGLSGRLKRQRMRDIVSDSEGEIFASYRGELRLYLEKNDAVWVERGRHRRLTRVPIEKNYNLIYNRLGTYLGVPLYTPCDDF